MVYAVVDFLSGGAVAAMVFQGENVIAAGRKMIGSTKPSDSAPGTIRGDFGITVGRNISTPSLLASPARYSISRPVRMAFLSLGVRVQLV